jgi:hypothetical protein
MNCYYHADVDAVSTCSNCGKALCQNCSVDVTGRIICQQCLSSGNITRIQPQPTQFSQPLQPSKPYNILAMVSLGLGIFGLCGPYLFSVPAWITGYFARKQITENPAQEGMQLATAGMWLGIVTTILYTIGFSCYIGGIVILAILTYSRA